MNYKKGLISMQNPAVSVIMPAYNAEKYIEKSIASVIGQTMKDFELIIINDGSKDRTSDIIEHYEREYPDHIRHYDKEHGGLSGARNYGMNLAIGDYITFIDSDDYFDCDFLDHLYSAAKQNGSDMVLSGQRKVDEYGGTIANISYPVDKYPDYPLRRLNIAGKMYRRDFLVKHGLYFPENKSYEDNSFNLVAMFLCKNMVILPYIGYSQIIHDKSITMTRIREDQIPYDALENSIKYVISHKEEINDYGIFEFTVLSFFAYFIFVANKKNMYCKTRQKGRKSDIWLVTHLCRYVQHILETYLPDYYKNNHVGIFKDMELEISQRLGVWIFVKLCRFKLLEPFARFYYIF